MNEKKDEKWLDELICRVVDSGKLKFDAEKWKQKHPEEFEILLRRTEQASLADRPKVLKLLARSRTARIAAITSVAAAVLVVCSILLNITLRAAPDVGRVRKLYGIVALRDGGLSKEVMEGAYVGPGQWVQVLAGSKAEVWLTDGSRLLPEPRTAFQVNARKDGLEILLERGAMTVEAAAQRQGKFLTIKTNGSRIRVLGTRLDVRLVKKPDGTRQTRVSVASGSVQLESAGEKVVLLPYTEGIADEGQTPVSRSANLEVNEMIRLFNKNNELAAQSNVQAGLPVAIDFMGGSSATVWTVVPWEKLEATGTERYSLRLKHPAFGVKAFSLDGVAVNVDGSRNVLRIDSSNAVVTKSSLTHLILKIPNVRGLFRAEEQGVFGFDRPPSAGPGITLFQFRLPEGAHIHEVSGEIIERATRLNKLVITVAANSRMPEIFY
ncbi:MAG: FecR domain-containing protein [Planctomycetota bacterium]|jgi:ferric-dicitrate binding protein FerR (iron transport regulator)